MATGAADPKRVLRWLFPVAIAVGAYLRLDQFLAQTLIDDEWHAIHQLIYRTPSEFALSFGHADYSIPLTLLYWVEAQFFGLSELGMRWPMMACGLATLVAFPLFARRFGLLEATTFAFLIATSPMLIAYSRTARPYAITLLLGFAAHYTFMRYREQSSGGTAHGACFVLCATAATWLHGIAGPFVVAPFLGSGWSSLRALRTDRGRSLARLVWLAVPTALAMLVVILPPLLADPDAISGKAGIHSPDWKTIAGVWYMWLGVSGTPELLFAGTLAGLGAARLWKEVAVARSALGGVLLTLVAVAISGPAWIHHPLTLGRYLLPMVPLLLLAVAFGAARTARWAGQVPAAQGMVLALAAILPTAAIAFRSPLIETLRHPNTNTLHSIFQFDFRPKHNPIPPRLDSIPLSPYWSALAKLPRDSVRVAAAPFYFESYDWDAPRWERIAGQRVLAGYLTGLCVTERAGEVPLDRRFRFRNSVHLADESDLRAKRIDLVVYQKPYPQKNGDLAVQIGADTAACEAAIRARFGTPIHEDAMIAVFSLGRQPSDAQR